MNGILNRTTSVGCSRFALVQQPDRPSCCQSDLLLKTSSSSRIGTGIRPS